MLETDSVIEVAEIGEAHLAATSAVSDTKEAAAVNVKHSKGLLTVGE